MLIHVAQCPLGCFNGGYCGSPNTCVCNTGWGGTNCTQGMYVNYTLGNILMLSCIRIRAVR